MLINLIRVTHLPQFSHTFQANYYNYLLFAQIFTSGEDYIRYLYQIHNS